MSKHDGLDGSHGTGSAAKHVPAHRERLSLRVQAREGDHNAPFSQSERELLNEVERAVRSINYGSIVLTIHEGRLVEISKTVRLRNLQVRGEGA